MKKPLLGKRIFVVLVAIMLSFCQLSVVSAGEFDAKIQETETFDEGVESVEAGTTDNISAGNVETEHPEESNIVDTSEDNIEDEGAEEAGSADEETWLKRADAELAIADAPGFTGEKIKDGDGENKDNDEEKRAAESEVKTDELIPDRITHYDDLKNVPKNQHDAIMSLHNMHIFYGPREGAFEPFASVSRGDVILALWKAAGRPDAKTREPVFKDAKDYVGPIRAAVCWAYENDIARGFTDGTFRENAPCTRGQLITFLWRFKGMPDVKAKKSPFKDINKENVFYRQITWAGENGVSAGYIDKTFKPGRYCNRAQCATFIYRMLQL